MSTNPVPPAGSNDPTGNPHPPKDPPPTPAAEIQVPQIPGTHHAHIDGGAPERDVPKPKGDDGPAKESFLHKLEDSVGEALGEAFEDR